MYKKVLWLLMFFVVMFSMTYASLEEVNFRFCDDVDNSIHLANKKVIAVNPWEDSEVCVVFLNAAKEKIQVRYGFSYWLLNEQGNQVCDQDSTPNNKFSKFFVQSWENILTLNSWEKQTLKVPVSVPIGVSGMQYWCFVYQLMKQADSWGIFSVVVRKIFPLNLFVGGSADIKKSISLLKLSWWLYSTNNKIRAEINDENNMTLYIKVKNEGNITQDIELSGRIYNFLWFEKMFTASQKKLTPGEEREIMIEWWIVPGYKGFFTAKININHIPVFDFDMSDVDNEIKMWWTLTEKTNIYAFSRISLVVVIVLILFIIKLIKPRKNKSTVIQ